jgi:hypothetical protein
MEPNGAVEKVQPWTAAVKQVSRGPCLAACSLALTQLVEFQKCLESAGKYLGLSNLERKREDYLWWQRLPREACDKWRP